MPVAGITPPAPARSVPEQNLDELSQSVPKAVWTQFQAPRGVKLFIHDELYMHNYEMCIEESIPVETCFQRPASSIGGLPGLSRVTCYLQSKGHWFWALSQLFI